MRKEIKPDRFIFYTDDLCDYVPNDYCRSVKCEQCKFYHTPGIADVTLYSIKDKEDENE